MVTGKSQSGAMPSRGSWGGSLKWLGPAKATASVKVVAAPEAEGDATFLSACPGER